MLLIQNITCDILLWVSVSIQRFPDQSNVFTGLKYQHIESPYISIQTFPDQCFHWSQV